MWITSSIQTIALLAIGLLQHRCVNSSSSQCIVSLASSSITNGEEDTLAAGRWTRNELIASVGENATGDGVPSADSNITGFCSFYGLPYARPPLGALRFEPPQEHHPAWSGQQDFSDDSDPIMCVQKKPLIGEVPQIVIVGTEDCLYLDVHAPHSSDQEPKSAKTQPLWPVVVWLHGGSFNLGWSRSDVHGPDYLVMQGIVLVAVNYRLAALGFLALPDANIAGNMGLLDQRMALRWVQKHISAFGGDPSRVTLMGWSAGAASVGYQMLPGDTGLGESTEELFHRAIMMSGAPTNLWAVQNVPSNCSQQLLRKLGLTDTPAADLKASLQAIPASRFVLKNMYHDAFVVFGSLEFCFVPIVDGRFVPTAPHLLPDERFAAASTLKRPLLIGYTRLETATQFEQGFGWRDVRWPSEGRHDDILDRLSGYMDGQLRTERIEDEAQRSRRLLFMESLRAVVDIKYGIWQFAERYERMVCRPFVYQFSFGGPWGDFRHRITSEAHGPVHGDELGYLFADARRSEGDDKQAEEAAAVRDRMVSMWANFIKTGTIYEHQAETDSCRFNSTESDVANDLTLLDIDRQTTTVPLRHCQQCTETRLWEAILQCTYAGKCQSLLGEYLPANRSLLSDSAGDDMERRCMLMTELR